MGMWILESRSMEHVPGTTRYFDDPERPQAATAESAGLKCDTSGSVPIILVPQPSDDPNDPLNWPLWKRDVIMLILCVVSIFATSLGPILAANTITISIIFSRRFTDVAILTGYFLLGVGIAGILCVPSARIWGKRHLFLLGTVIVIFSSAWGGASRSYASLLWARIFQGIGTAPFEALVNAAVGDLYFVHERGKRMALTNLAVFGGAFFTPILVGKITESIGWSWTFYLVTIFTSACLPLVIFFVPETAYRRSAHLNTDLLASDATHNHLYPKSEDPDHQLQNLDQQDPITEQAPTDPESAHKVAIGSSSSTPKKSFTQSLLPFNGRVSDESFWELFLRPFPLFAHPAILWACLIQGSMIGWTVFIGIILAAIFIGPPLLWGEVNTGYAYTGAFLGAVIGFLIAGALADWSAKYMTRKNGGIYEPEFRIVLVIPQLIFGCAGLFLFGITANRLVDYSYILPIVGFGLEVGGMVIGAVAASLYIVDAHRDIAVEAFTCILIFKNFFTAGLTWSAYDWLVKSGTLEVFMWISGIQVFICLLSIPMYVFGKKNRSFFHRHDIQKITASALRGVWNICKPSRWLPTRLIKQKKVVQSN
ncbi:MFS transporter-like protein [Cadophora sp. DSE1049]|nr:MFS transporter-like protein [Cadophora sp. DSE1049]